MGENLREQVITPRAGRALQGAQGGGRASGVAVSQRPAKRKGRGHSSGAGGAMSWRSLLRYAPLMLKIALAIGAGYALFTGYRAAASASFFRLDSVDVDGASRTSKDEVRAIVRRGVAGVGVWRADLAAISAELKNQPWVREAVVTRVLPSGVRVRIREREPHLVVRTSGGRFVWADEDGVLLGAAQATDRLPPFFVRGLDEAPTASASAANGERVRKALEMARQWGAAGIANRVSEVNLDDLHDVRAQLSGDDAQIEVRLGRDEFGARLARALKVLDGLRDSPRGTVVRLDATQEKRVIVGFGSNALPSGESVETPEQADAASRTPDGNALTSTPARTNDGGAETKKKVTEKQRDGAREAKRASERKDTKRAEREKKEKKEEKKARRDDGREEKNPGRQPATVVAERPRRVG